MRKKDIFISSIFVILLVFSGAYDVEAFSVKETIDKLADFINQLFNTEKTFAPINRQIQEENPILNETQNNENNEQPRPPQSDSDRQTAISQDSSSQMQQSTVQEPVNEEQKLEISNIKIESVTSDSVYISWNINKPSQFVMEYGLFSGIYIYTFHSSGNSTYSAYLTNLKPSTKYYFVITAYSKINDRVKSTENSFVTLTSSVLSNTTETSQIKNSSGSGSSGGGSVSSTPAPSSPGNCGDGTSLNQCSSTNPKYCNSNAQLINNCASCSCAAQTGYTATCNGDGTCSYTPEQLGGGDDPIYDPERTPLSSINNWLLWIILIIILAFAYTKIKNKERNR